MTFVIPYPMIDPVLLEFGPVAIRWYSLAYIGGLILAWRYMRVLASHPPEPASALDIDDFILWAALGVVFGGRFGYVLFYKPEFFLDNPLAILQVWRGGMSFHGGVLGVLVAGTLFARRRSIAYLPFADLLACAAPIGLFLGRLANFINAELIGRVTDVPWAMVFPGGGDAPRHPSQLYEAGLEGLGLFTLLLVLWRMEGIRRRAGLLTGVFLTGYAVARAFAELFRQPDVHIGFLLGGTTMGQWLSAPMLAIGVYLIVSATREE
jgi:phosphatidylglycerol:prolipoprotein diacylglycerol transferase